MIRPHALQFTVTGRKEMPVEGMADNLCKAADMVLDFHEAAAEVERAKAKL